MPASSEPFRVVIAGLGTVGCGVLALLADHGDLIAQRAGRPIEVAAVNSRNRDKARAASIESLPWTDDPAAFCRERRADALVELIGGAEGAAKAMAFAALGQGTAFVTANKALLSHHGYELAVLAEQNDAPLCFEAAVAGGIPIIKTLREGLAANAVITICGILNGTCNYILSEMRETGRDFAGVLASAQALGYAEADPAFDVGGTDAAHKLSLLSALAFGHRPDLAGVRTTGIAAITSDDIRFAGELGYRVKLLGIARRARGKGEGGVQQSVEPCLVPATGMLGDVEGIFNAVYVKTDFAGRSLSVGRGAGAHPTASAVVADLIDLARGQAVPAFGIRASDLTIRLEPSQPAPSGPYYLRIEAIDRPGVLAGIAAAMSDLGISAESVIQRGHDPGKPVSIVVVTHAAEPEQIARLGSALALQPSLVQAPTIMRIENI